MMEVSSAALGIRPNKLALLALITAGCAIGWLPYLMFIGHVWYLGVVVVVWAAVAFWELRKSDALAAANPSLGEWLVAAWSTVGLPAGGSGIAMLFYALVYLGVVVWVEVLNLLGFRPTADPSSIAKWLSMVVAAIFVVRSPLEESRLLLQGLYPRTAGTRSVFFPLLNRPYRLTGVVVGTLLAAGLLLPYASDWPIAVPVLLGILFYYSSYPLFRLAAFPASADRQQETLRMLFELAGYGVVRSPRTGKPEVDPLIQNVDLFVRAGENAFAVQVQSLGRADKADWQLASTLRTAASILGEERADDEGAPLRVTPVLVLLGGEITPSLTRLKEAESIPVAHFRDPAVFEAESSSPQLDGAIASELRAIGIPLPAPKPASEGEET